MTWRRLTRTNGLWTDVCLDGLRAVSWWPLPTYQVDYVRLDYTQGEPVTLELDPGTGERIAHDITVTAKLSAQ